MALRVGVDVGGTFTKAVACDARSGEVVARAVVPTSHSSHLGVAQGVVDALTEVTGSEEVAGAGSVLVVAHSTTQAVNALLEGDTATVGIIGIGRRPDVRRSRRRTQVGKIRLAPGHDLETVHEFIDASEPITTRDVEGALDRLVERGAQSLCVSESFGVENASAERFAARLAAERGLAVCASHELSGLYGLEMRTITGALNASILPTALATAGVVEKAVGESVPGAPLLVMRGDGGAADLASMRRHPLVTAFSGPAASVSGALRHLSFSDGVVVEVGGTSTNVSTVKGGRPVLAYVRVLDHVTCVRSLDVRVVGVAGGSLVRLTQRRGGLKVADVGPRSAHIAGLEYACFADPSELEGARLRLISPRPGDPADYAVLETRAGRLLAPTLTCAANALEVVARGSYATAGVRAARAAWEVIGRATKGDWRSSAQAALDLASARISQVVSEAAQEQELVDPLVVGLGGGAGALLPGVAARTSYEWRLPPDAEVISSIGDALSLVRVELEGNVVSRGPDAVADLHRRAEEAAVAAGAAPQSLQVEGQPVPERSALRVIATGSVALEAGALIGDEAADEETMQLAAKRALGDDAILRFGNEFYAVYATSTAHPSGYAVVDRRGSLATTGVGRLVVGSGVDIEAELDRLVAAETRHLGPVSVAPGIRLLRGARLVDLTLFSEPAAVVEAAILECRLAGGSDVVVFVGPA